MKEKKVGRKEGGGKGRMMRVREYFRVPAAPILIEEEIGKEGRRALHHFISEMPQFLLLLFFLPFLPKKSLEKEEDGGGGRRKPIISYLAPLNRGGGGRRGATHE